MKKLLVACSLALALAGCSSDSWLKNIGAGTAVGCVGGAVVGSKTGWVGGPHAIATATGVGCATGAVVGATLPHKHF